MWGPDPNVSDFIAPSFDSPRHHPRTGRLQGDGETGEATGRGLETVPPGTAAESREGSPMETLAVKTPDVFQPGEEGGGQNALPMRGSRRAVSPPTDSFHFFPLLNS